MVDSLFRMRQMWWRLVILLWAGSISAAMTSPNIILITLDTTRADRMGFLGSKRGLTPNLDALAKQGVVFTRAYSQVPLTTASHATILTGTYPQFNEVNDFGKQLQASLPYLPDLLHGHGYRTAAFVGSLVLDPISGTAPGFDRGFDVYNAGFRLRRVHEDRYQTIERRADDVVGHAVKWLSRADRGPFFMWVHLYDAHDPYDPPAPFAGRYKTAAYDGEIAYVDSAVGKLMAALRSRNLYQASLIAVMADHGEALGEHGEETHGVFLYDETIRVPLLFKLPGERSAGRRSDARVGLVDVTPTLLRLAGIEIPTGVQGESLVPLMESGPERSDAPGKRPAANAARQAADWDRAIYSETDYPHRAFGWSSLRALRAGKYLFVQAPRRELYDTHADPAATRNLAPTAPAVVDTMAAQAEKFHNQTAKLTEAGGEKLDPEQQAKLSALGYVSSDAGPGGGKTGEPEADPKDKVEVANLLHDALLDVEDGRYRDAVPRLERALAEQSDMAIAQMQLGMAWARLRNYEKAIPPLESAIRLLPDSGMAHYELGLARFETGDWQAAAPQFEAAVARAPRWADAHFSLASVYARIDRVPEALQELETTLKLSPDHYRANLLRGRILSLQGNPAGALANLQKAVAVQPDSREAHLFLADAYAQLGEEGKAQSERREAERSGSSR